MAADDHAVLHFVDPIARFRDRRVVRHEEQSFAFFAHDFLQQAKGSAGIGGVEIAGRLIGQDDARIVRERAGDRDPLLFAAGKMPARPAQFFPETDFALASGRPVPAFRLFREATEPAHRDHDVFLRGEILEQEMELEDEAEELVPFLRELIVGQVAP